jgi:hypothetical protein
MSIFEKPNNSSNTAHKTFGTIFTQNLCTHCKYTFRDVPLLCRILIILYIQIKQAFPSILQRLAVAYDFYSLALCPLANITCQVQLQSADS